jgi:two-component system LytT family response regulator
VHLTDKSTLVVSKNIGEYDKTLAPKFFYRIHKRFLINIKYIVNINNADGSNCELKGNIMLPVAKRRKE